MHKMTLKTHYLPDDAGDRSGLGRERKSIAMETGNLQEVLPKESLTRDE